MEKEFFVNWDVEALLFEIVEYFGSKVEVMNHAVVVWAEADEVF